MQNSAYRQDPEEKKELTIHQLKDYYGMLDASSTISQNTGDEFDARAEAKKLVKAWKKTEAEAERIKENAEKYNTPLYQSKPQNKTSKREVDAEIQKALEEVKREKKKDQNLSNLNSSQTTLSGQVMSRLYKWEFQPLEDEEPQTLNNRRDFARSRRDDSLSDYSRSPGRSASPSMKDGYRVKSRILDKVYDLRKEERSRERSPGMNSTLGASLSQISKYSYSARDGYSGSQRPVTGYDKKTGINKMYLDPILENEDIENKLKKFEDEIKQDREKLRTEQRYRQELEENKKNIDKTLNEMKVAHEESRMAYKRFLMEKFTIRVEKVLNNLAMYYKRQFYISLLTGLYDQNVRLGKHNAKVAFKTKSLHFCAWMEYTKINKMEKEIQRKEMSLKQEQELERRMEAHYRRRLLKKFFFKGILKHHLLTKQEKEIVAAQGVMKLKVNNFISKLKQNIESMPEPRIATPERFSLQASQATTHNNRYQEESPADTEYYGTPQKSVSKSPHSKSPVDYNPYHNTKSPVSQTTPNSAVKSRGLVSPISRNSYTERPRPETGNSGIKKNLDQGTQSSRNSVRPVDIVFPGNQSHFQNISSIQGSNMGISKITNNSVFNAGPSPSKHIHHITQSRIEETFEVEEPRIFYTQGDTVDYMYSPSRAPSDSRVTQNISPDISRGRADNKENSGSHLPSIRGVSGQKTATNNTMNTTSTVGAGGTGGIKDKEKDKKPTVTAAELELRAKERKDKAAFIKAKHDEEKKKKDLEKKEREQKEKEELIKQKLEEKKKLEDKRRQERLAKERKEQEEAAMIMKMNIAKDFYHRQLVRHYGFLAFARIKEMKARHKIRANEYRRRALLRRGIENWLQGLAVIKIENEARLADSYNLAAAHYEGSLIRLGFAALFKNRVICQDQYKGFENYRFEYVKRKCFSKWFENLTHFKREKYDIEAHYDSIIQRFQMMILFQRTLKSLKKNVEESRIDKLKKEHRDIMWSKVNGWLDEFNKGKSSK